MIRLSRPCQTALISLDYAAILDVGLVIANEPSK